MVSPVDAFEARFGGIAPHERDHATRALDSLYARGRAAYPNVDVPADALATCVAERVLGAAAIVPAIEAVPADEAYLAAGCALGSRPALDAFEQRYMAGARDALRRMGRAGAEIEDTLQRLRERLFVAPAGQTARICALVGGGDLAALVRIAAIRLALNAKRDDRRIESDPEPVLEQVVLDLDPEAELIAEDARAHIKRAFTETLETLSPRDRTLLKLHLVHRLSIDEIGATFRVHRSTAARWLATIRSALEDGTLHRLRERLHGDDGELASLIRAVRDRLEISFSRVLAS